MLDFVRTTTAIAGVGGIFGEGGFFDGIKDAIFGQDAVRSGLEGLLSSAGDVVETCIPYGIGLMVILAAPRLIKRIIHSFM